jgi:hypothetical protein
LYRPRKPKPARVINTKLCPLLLLVSLLNHWVVNFHLWNSAHLYALRLPGRPNRVPGWNNENGGVAFMVRLMSDPLRAKKGWSTELRESCTW